MTSMTSHKIFYCKRMLLLLTLFFNIDAGHCEQPLVFISAPDIHNIEAFMREGHSTKLSQFDVMLAGMASFNPSFVLLPGDLGSQHWWENKYKSICAQDGTVRDTIMGCASKTYPKLLSYMDNYGLPLVYVVVGDHEIGDNNWGLGIRSDSVPYFKEAFAKYFTKNADGSSRFNGSLGGVPLRPIGTPYEHTSYAFQIANVLFVVVDEFRQDSPKLVLSRLSTVKATVDYDGQMQWLDRLLSAAKQQAGIQHIIVSGHLPVLSPVRGQKSSMLYFDSQRNSDFWKLLQKYKVDVYLAGEVHKTTVIKDPDSNVMQIAHKSGCNGDDGGFLVGRVYADRIELDQQSLRVDIDGTISLAKEGTLFIDKAAGQFRYWASESLLKPIDPSGLVVHYSFDEDISHTVKNHGSFGACYDAAQHNVWPLTSGSLTKLGNAAWFSNTQQSIVSTSGITPIAGQQPRTISVWIRTDYEGPGAYIHASGQLWDTSSHNAFRLLVENGILKLQINSKIYLQANQGMVKLNDNAWHHVAATFNRNWSAKADEVLFYIDGQEYESIYSEITAIFTETNSDKVNVGGRREDHPLEGWTGSLDDFAIWASALTPPMIKAINTCAQALAYNASDMESLFALYRKRTGTIEVNGLTWKYGIQLSGAPGACELDTTSNTYSITMDAEGQGVTTQAADTPHLSDSNIYYLKQITNHLTKLTEKNIYTNNITEINTINNNYILPSNLKIKINGYKRAEIKKNAIYGVTIKNKGPLEAKEVTAKIVLPPNTRFIENVSDTRCHLQDDVVTCQAGSITKGHGRRFKITLIYQNKGKFIIKAQATSLNQDTLLSNDAASFMTKVKPHGLKRYATHALDFIVNGF
jgi:uncharacterized repeat protein (TIGR01451 family)